MKCEVITSYFERNSKYRKLLRVLLKSAKKVGEKVRVIKMKKPKNIDHKRDTAYSFLDVTKYVLNSKNNIIIVDCDMMFRKKISNLFNKYPNFDIAVSVRPYPKYNTGLWAARNTLIAKEFIKRWIQYTRFLMRHYDDKKELLYNQGGIDQASLYLTIKEYNENNIFIGILELPCIEWNACQSEWWKIDQTTRLIHIKSKLRLACMDRIDIPEGLEELVKEWKGYYDA